MKTPYLLFVTKFFAYRFSLLNEKLTEPLKISILPIEMILSKILPCQSWTGERSPVGLKADSAELEEW